MDDDEFLDALLLLEENQPGFLRRLNETLVELEEEIERIKQSISEEG